MGSRESGGSEVPGHLGLHSELQASLDYPRAITKQQTPSEQVLRRDPEETGLGCGQLSSVFVGHAGCRGETFLPHSKCAVTTRHRALRTPLTPAFAPPRPGSPSGQYVLEKDGKTHKNLPNKINMRCRQKPRWVGREVSAASRWGGPVTSGLWLQKNASSPARDKDSLSLPPPKKKKKQKEGTKLVGFPW